jgi:hypothetical protein
MYMHVLGSFLSSENRVSVSSIVAQVLACLACSVAVVEAGICTGILSQSQLLGSRSWSLPSLFLWTIHIAEYQSPVGA